MGFRNCRSGRKNRGIGPSLTNSFLFCLYIIAVSAPPLWSHAAAPEAPPAAAVTIESVTANLTKSQSPAKHWIDSIAEAPFTDGKAVSVPAGLSVVKILGWAVDPDARLAAGALYVEIDGKAYPAEYGINRRDVVDAFHTEAYAFSGYLCRVPVSALGPGQHTLALIILSNDKKTYYRAQMKPLIIEQK